MSQQEMEDAIKQRVAQVLKECKISVNRLANAFDISQRTLNDQINGNSKITAATLIALAKFRSDISAEWLLRGTGEMYLSDNVAGKDGNDTATTRQKDETPTGEQRENNGSHKINIELEVSEGKEIKLRLLNKVIQLVN